MPCNLVYHRSQSFFVVYGLNEKRGTETAEAKVDEFDFIVMNEDILKLNVPVDNIFIVQVTNGIDQLITDIFDFFG